MRTAGTIYVAVIASRDWHRDDIESPAISNGADD